MTQITLKVSVALVTVFCCSTSLINGEYSEEPDGPCSPFKQVFNDGMACSSDALQQFHVAMSPCLAYKLFYKLVSQVLLALKTPNVKHIAQNVANISLYRAECITPKQTADVNASAMEQILEVAGVLTNENAASLATKYLKCLEKTRKAHGFKGSPQSNLMSVFKANLDFIKDSVHCNENTGEIVTQAFEKYFAAVPCCCAGAND